MKILNYVENWMTPKEKKELTKKNLRILKQIQ